MSDESSDFSIEDIPVADPDGSTDPSNPDNEPPPIVCRTALHMMNGHCFRVTPDYETTMAKLKEAIDNHEDLVEFDTIWESERDGIGNQPYRVAFHPRLVGQVTEITKDMVRVEQEVHDSQREARERGVGGGVQIFGLGFDR
jgi:hypothetical protein